MMVGVFYGAWVLHERVTAARLAGVGCMVAGVAALALA
jgi:drug/metabolite transporter (DMT)-like permease